MTRTSCFVRLGALSFVSAVLTGAAIAQTTVNIAAKNDNTLYEDPTGSLSNGAGGSFFVGQTATGAIRRAVVRFDVGTVIPAGAKVVAASLTLSVVQSTDILPLPTGAHRVSQAWGEGTSVAPGNGGGGGPAALNDATWIHTFSNTSLWTNAGGDFAAVPSFTLALPQSGVVNAPAEPGLVTDVQSWIDTPATNFGWVLKAQSEATAGTARRIASKEALSGRPFLTVTYLLPGEIGTWGTGCPSPVLPFSAAWSGPMIGGTTLNLNHTNGPANGIGANLFALELNQPGVLVAPSCPIFLPLSGNWIAGNVFVFDGAGAAASPWPVPTAYPGLFFMSQSLSPDVTAPFGLVFSNAVVAVIQ